MKNFLTLLALLALALTWSCGSDSSSEEATMEEAADVVMEEAEEAIEPAEDKSQRPSPPRTASGNIGGADIVIDYSSPSVKGRKIWGGLVPYGKIWRTGANEATTFVVSEDVMVEGQMLPAGKYGLFTIPSEDKWIVIFNTVHEQWGAYDYDEEKDALRVEVTPEPAEESVEAMEFDVEDDAVVLRWERMAVPIRISAAS